MGHFRVEAEIKHTLAKTIHVDDDVEDMEQARIATERALKQFELFGVDLSEVVITRCVKIDEPKT